jgi:threonine/homoserine/homoserine lactone efflux protein
MTFHIWLVFVVTEGLLSLTPGPAVLLVVGNGMKAGAAMSRWSAAGILFTNACYFTLSALGLGAALLAAESVFTAVRWLGVAYLVYLGLKMIWSAKDEVAGDTAVSPTHPKSNWQTFSQGVALQAGNPKAILFFVALLPQFIVTATSVLPQFLILGLTSIVLEAIILVVYGLLAAKAGSQFQRPRARLWQERLSGGMLMTAAIGLSLVGQSK